MFTLQHQDGSARAGLLTTPHGTIATPVFMPVGTQATVKAMPPWELQSLHTQILLGNTYHLFLRPGLDVIRPFGGLHSFMGWHGPILTDSGGFQVFSLARLRRITEEGVHFQSHIDGAPCFLSPEIAMEIQDTLNSDIAMLFDECPPYPCDHTYAARSWERTLRWAKRCRTWCDAHPDLRGRLHFGIVQGGVYPDLRRESAEALVQLGWDGYAIGGVSVGEPEAEMFKAAEHTTPYLPTHQPRYCMGLGTPPQMLELIARGIDMFDCVLPTRIARNGTAFTRDGTLNLKNAQYRSDPQPIEPGCTCPVCSRFSRAYLRHLIKADEILGLQLVTIHNLHFYLQLLRDARQAILENHFTSFRTTFVERYRPWQPPPPA